MLLILTRKIYWVDLTAKLQLKLFNSNFSKKNLNVVLFEHPNLYTTTLEILVRNNLNSSMFCFILKQPQPSQMLHLIQNCSVTDLRVIYSSRWIIKCQIQLKGQTWISCPLGPIKKGEEKKGLSSGYIMSFEQPQWAKIRKKF